MKINHPNLTLEFIQNMSKEEARELFGRGKGINVRQLIMSTILAASKLHWPETRGVREFWYNPIKPILYNVIGEDANIGRKYDNFNGYLSSMVKAGIIKYKQLGIVDYSTQRELYESMDKSECWNNVILFVEKDSAYVHLRPLKNLLNITILSGGGVSKTACAEAMITNMKPLDYTIFTVTDYNPWGFFIGREAVEKFGILGMSIKNSHRIVINPDQMPDGIVQVQRFPVAMNTSDSQEWCEKYGLGPSGMFGLEIEAVSGQPGGAQQLRQIVLEALLEHLDEDDRIWEMTKDAWEDMPLGAAEYYLDDFTWTCWKQTSVPMPLDEYITQEVYDVRKAILEEQKQDELSPWESDLERVEVQINLNEELKDEAITENTTEYDEQIEEKEEEHLNPLFSIIDRIEAEQIFPIRRRIMALKEVHVKPLEEQKDRNEEQINDSYDQIESDLQSHRTSIETSMEDVEDNYDTERSTLDNVFENSRAIFAQSVIDWLSENKDDYYNTGLDDKDYSMGVIRGFLKEACKDGKTAQDILKDVENWDKDTPYEWITSDIWSSMDVIMGYVSTYLERCKEEN